MTKKELKNIMTGALMGSFGPSYKASDEDVSQIWDAYDWCAKEEDPTWHAPTGVPFISAVSVHDWGKSFFFRISYPGYACASDDAFQYNLTTNGTLRLTKPMDM